MFTMNVRSVMDQVSQKVIVTATAIKTIVKVHAEVLLVPMIAEFAVAKVFQKDTVIVMEMLMAVMDNVDLEKSLMNVDNVMDQDYLKVLVTVTEIQQIVCMSVEVKLL